MYTLDGAPDNHEVGLVTKHDSLLHLYEVKLSWRVTHSDSEWRLPGCVVEEGRGTLCPVERV